MCNQYLNQLQKIERNTLLIEEVYHMSAQENLVPFDKESCTANLSVSSNYLLHHFVVLIGVIVTYIEDVVTFENVEIFL